MSDGPEGAPDVTIFDSALDAALAAIRAQRGGASCAGLAVGELDMQQPEQAPCYRTALALCATAASGEILADELVERLLAGTDVTLAPAAASGVYALHWEPQDRRVVRVVIADDAALIRSGIARLLADAGFDVAREVADADALVRAVEAEHPDLVVTDVRMPPDGRDAGLRAAAEIRAAHPEVAVLVLSQYIEARSAATLLDERSAGVGYLLKERVGNVDDFVDACRAVLAGGRIVDELVAHELLRNRRAGDPIERLTDRERDVLSLMSQGRSNAAIASQLAISAKTLEAHVRSIFTKLDLPESPDDHRRVAAVVTWLQRTA